MLLAWAMTLFTAILGASESETTPDHTFAYVCRDAGNGAYEAFPDVARLKDGRLACVFYAGYTHVSMPTETCPRGGRIAVCYSNDEGGSWSPAQTLYDGPDDDRDPSITQLNDGRVLCTFFSLKKKEGGGYTGLGSWIVESADGCRTWSEPRLISKTYYCSSPVRELAESTLILGLYQESDTNANGAVVLSHDKGKTWGDVINIDNGGLRLDAETDVIALKDGQLYAAQRTASESMRYSISQDNGKTWTISKSMGFPGHCPYLFRTPENIILCATRNPGKESATSLRYSADECKTWSEVNVVDKHNGAYPSMVSLKDGSTLIVYYEEGEGSSIRARKFRATKSGIAWLDW